MLNSRISCITLRGRNMNQDNLIKLEKILQTDYANIAGMVVLKDGNRVYETYLNGCTANSNIHEYSVTKSILSILVGIAIDQGYITSVTQKVLDFFPDYPVKTGEHTIQDVTIQHLLTMTAPYRYKFAPYIKYFTCDDSVQFTLDLLGGRGKIGTFRYTPLIGPDILSGIVVKATGQSLLAFATEHLFSPLGITVKRSLIFHSKEEQLAFNAATDVSGWAADAKGINAGGWGLTLTAADMAKFGQLYLDMGMYNGKQIVSKEWVAESTRQHSRWDKRNLEYGYLWWVFDHGFAAMGDGGNIIYGNKDKGLVIAIASLFTPKAKDRIELIEKHLEPMFGD